MVGSTTLKRNVDGSSLTSIDAPESGSDLCVLRWLALGIVGRLWPSRGLFTDSWRTGSPVNGTPATRRCSVLPPCSTTRWFRDRVHELSDEPSGLSLPNNGKHHEEPVKRGNEVNFKGDLLEAIPADRGMGTEWRIDPGRVRIILDPLLRTIRVKGELGTFTTKSWPLHLATTEAVGLTRGPLGGNRVARELVLEPNHPRPIRIVLESGGDKVARELARVRR